MTYGNIGSKSFSCKFYYSGAKPNFVTDANRYQRFDVYYTPKDSVVQARITSAGSANNYFATRIAVSNSDDYLINLGTFFLDNYRFKNNVGEIDLVDCLGFLRSKVYRYDGGYASDPENPVIQYVVDEIATICDLHWISGNFGGTLKMLFGETLKLYGASNWNGATCYDVLQQIARACGGFVKSVPGNSISDIAFSILYGGNQLTQAAIPGFPYYNCNIEYDNVYSIKAAPSNADYLGARYLGNDCTYGTQLYVDVAQNDIWDGDISQYQTQAQQESRTQTLLQSIDLTCGLPGFRPNRSITVACPIYETLDIVGIALDANGYAGTIITTIKMSGLGKMEVSYAGDIDVQQNYITGGGQLSAGVRKNTSAINKLNDQVAALKEYIDDLTMYKAGDTESFSYFMMPAAVYNNGKQITMTLNVPKSMYRISSITLTEFKGTITGVNGTAGGTSLTYNWLTDANLSLGSTSPWKASRKAIGITFNATNALSNIQGTGPLIVYCSSIKLSFN